MIKGVRFFANILVIFTIHTIQVQQQNSPPPLILLLFKPKTNSVPYYS